MKQLFFVAVGVVIGFAVAHQVARTPGGARLFAVVDASTKAFTGAVADGYRSRGAELRTDV
ncbi:MULTISPECIES: hypothetical protein [Curtobacterium]|uniref:Uncharacterized protein n=1 Tax=Curtobacterium citreum TaxID=2036 RepID=A0ABU8Y9G2_9MICO|nr:MULTISPECIES: hypothetical protein [Curtobacterium]NQW89383.1 hypothetical protein [Curtobacterium sp. VKM Ac-2861]PZO57691.1 MAG: hypothetical protein DI639_12715 [Leifsonia xyli]MBF4586224.1 hypothetical protein [Curtobacterium sp. VKM Ac-2887]MBF4604296.1 hypothetical protein [Curtobacterium sp. VKM Ac-2884]MBT1622552.1 hypothetical protein [Curtobacterium flaccumfaciens pv. oortii]